MKTILTNSIFFLIIVSFITSCNSPSNLNKNAPTNSSNTTNLKPTPTCDDAQITADLAKTYSNPPFAADSKNFNFFSKGCEVTLYGGVSDATIRQQAIDAAKNTPGVTAVIAGDDFHSNTTSTTRPEPGSCACPNDYKACGDICIPSGDQCNIKGLTCGTLVGTPTPVKTP